MLRLVQGLRVLHRAPLTPPPLRPHPLPRAQSFHPRVPSSLTDGMHPFLRHVRGTVPGAGDTEPAVLPNGFLLCKMKTSHLLRACRVRRDWVPPSPQPPFAFHAPHSLHCNHTGHLSGCHAHLLLPHTRPLSNASPSA